ncbi:MAG: NADH:quinone oxidoreductase rane subunit, partial [Pseudomonadota bacterium]
VWLERRGSAMMQDRLGPNRCNVFGVKLGGVIQSIADVVKFVFKEEYLPGHITHKNIYLIAPIIVFATAYLTFSVMPLADSITIGDKIFVMQAMPYQMSVLWILAFAGLSVYGIILAGWSSHNKYGLLGGIRASAQVVSYEASLTLTLITMIVIYGSVNLNDMVHYQGELFFGFIPKWGVVMQPLAALIFIIVALAETNRAPFDTAEGESEIVAGYHTEYGAMRFATFMLGEYLAMASMSALIITVFFGGYQLPWLNTETLRENISQVSIAIMIIVPVLTLLFLNWARKNVGIGSTLNGKYAHTEIKALTILCLIVIVATLAIFGYAFIGELSNLKAQALTAVIQVGVFTLKFFAMTFVFVWVRWTLPRIRYDQLQMLGWKVLLPLSLLNILVTALVVVFIGG